MKYLKILLPFLFLFLCGTVSAQVTSTNAKTIQSTSGAPTGTCSPSGPPKTAVDVRTSNGHIYTCVAGTWTDVTAGGGGPGATVGLDNLAGVAINTSLISDTNDTDDLGSSGIKWRDLFLSRNATIGSQLAIGVAPGSFDIQVAGANTSSAFDAYSPAGYNWLLRGARGSLAAPTATQSGDFLGILGARGYHTTGGAGFDGGGPLILFNSTEIHTSTANGGGIVFQTVSNGATSPVTALTLGQNQAATFANTVNATTFVGALTGTASGNEVPLTFSTGLTRSTNTITVNTTQNILKLSGLTTNGPVFTSGGDGTLNSEAALAIARGGTGTGSTLTGLVRGSASAMTAAELSGVVVSSGSNVTTPGKIDVMQTSLYCSDAGANDTYTCSLSPAATAYVTGTTYRFKANTANTGAATINFNSVGALTIVKVQGAITTTLADNDIRVGQWVTCTYDGTNCQMVSQLGNAAAGSGTVTNIATTSPITGGPITTTGTIACATCVTSAAALASTAIVTGAGSQGSQTPAATATLDASGNISTPGSISSGVGGTGAGTFSSTNGTAPTLPVNSWSIFSPTTITTAFGWSAPTAENASAGLLHLGVASGAHISAMTVSPVSLTADVSGTLPVANGGTGIASGTSGGIPYFSGSNTIASSAALTANLPVIGGGAGVAPTVGSRTGNTTQFASWTGATTGSRCVNTDASGNLQITGADCGTGTSGNNAALATATADATVANTTTETSVIGTVVGSKTTTANYFAAGTSLVLEWEGYFSSAVTDTLDFKIKAGSTVVGSTGATAYGVLTNKVGRLKAIVTCRTAGATGTFIVNTIFETAGSALTSQEAQVLKTTTVTLDTTGTLAWDLTATWSAASASDTITGTNFVMFTPGTGIADPGANGFLDRTALNTVSSRTLTAGTGVGVTNGGGGGNPTFTFNGATLVNSQTLWDGTQTSRTLTADLSGTDPVLTFGSSSVDVTTGTLKEGGVSVSLPARTETLTNKTLTAPVINGATSASGNFDLSGSSGTFKTTSGAVTIGGGGGSTITDVATFTPAARTSGVAAYFTVNIPADTAQTAATESIGFKTVTATRQWATTGTVGLQRENFFAGPTYTSASASQTFTDAFTLYATPPVPGTNAIFTRGHTLGIVDSTSAASSVTGGLVVATTLGTTATSVGIGGGNINAGGTLTVGGAIVGSSTLSIGTSNAATVGTVELGAASDTTLSRDSAGVLAVEGVVLSNNLIQNSQSAAYTTVLADRGKSIYHPSADTTARTWTIDSNANVAYAIGTTITFINDCSAGTLTIAITSDTMILAGAGTTGSRTLAACGIATAVKMTATRWVINGTGLTFNFMPEIPAFMAPYFMDRMPMRRSEG